MDGDMWWGWGHVAGCGGMWQWVGRSKILSGGQAYKHGWGHVVGWGQSENRVWGHVAGCGVMWQG